MLVATSRTTFEPASLAVLTRRYGAGAPAVVELIRRTGGCTSPIRLEGESVAVVGEDWSSPCPAIDASRRLRASCSWPAAIDGSRGVLPARSGIAATPTSSSRPGWQVTKTEACRLTSPRTRSSSRRSPHHRSARSIAASSTRVACAPAGHMIRRKPANTECRCGCLERHAEGDPRIGQALCPDCYDYEAAALWNANLGALWRRTITYLPRELAALSRLSVAALRSQVRVAYAKVAEFQARGAVHVHAVIRLDGPRRSRHRAGGRSDGAASSGGRRPHRGASSGHGGRTRRS